MTHRDDFPRFSARSVRRGDAPHREACATPYECLGSESLGKPPFRSPMGHYHRSLVLPGLILMTDSRRLPDPLPAITGLPRGSAVILRHYEDAGREVLARRMASLCRARGLRLLIGGDGRLAAAVGADGLHLPDFMVRRGLVLRRRPGWIITAAAHSPAALRRAARAGADAVLLSPVFVTASHPGVPTLGIQRFARLCRRSPLPVYALGGITAATMPRLAAAGAVGIAGIGCFLNTGERDSP